MSSTGVFAQQPDLKRKEKKSLRPFDAGHQLSVVPLMWTYSKEKSSGFWLTVFSEEFVFFFFGDVWEKLLQKVRKTLMTGRAREFQSTALRANPKGRDWRSVSHISSTTAC